MVPRLCDRVCSRVHCTVGAALVRSNIRHYIDRGRECGSSTRRSDFAAMTDASEIARREIYLLSRSVICPRSSAQSFWTVCRTASRCAAAARRRAANLTDDPAPEGGQAQQSSAQHQPGYSGFWHPHRVLYPGRVLYQGRRLRGVTRISRILSRGQLVVQPRIRGNGRRAAKVCSRILIHGAAARMRIAATTTAREEGS